MMKKMILFDFILLSCMARLVASSSCTTRSEASFGKKLEVEPYFEETATEFFQCDLNCQEDGKCISLNFSINKSICQRLRRSHKRPTNHTLKGAIDWSYFVNPVNRCNQEPYPCARFELCERRTTPSGEISFCTHMVFGIPIKHRGCFKDEWPQRAIITLEGQDPVLDGRYQTRKNPVQKCYQAAKSRGFPGFAVQDGGWCASALDILATYNKYGPSPNCTADGEGGDMANDVYLILEQD